MQRINRWIVIFILVFLKNAWGSVQYPYRTLRRLASGSVLWEALPVGFFTMLYLIWTTVARNGISAHPLFLSFNLLKLTFAVVITFIIVVYSFVVVGRLLGGTGSVKTVLVPWAYSLVPTLVWFLVTSLLFFLFPPPRTLAWSGKLLSGVFLVFSWFLFFWKGILYYLTLRFGMRLDFFRILLASVILFPLGAVYALILYRLGIFRIPFI